MQEPSNLVDLPILLQQILSPSYIYKIKNYTKLEPKITTENVNIGQINVDLYVLNKYQEISKTTMRLTRTFPVKGNKAIIFKAT